MFGLTSLGRTVVSSGYNTWRNNPEEWGTQWEGFGRRVASGVGRNVIKQTTIYALDESFKLDSRFYQRIGQTGFRFSAHRRNLHGGDHRLRNVVSETLRFQRRIEKRHLLARHERGFQSGQGDFQKVSKIKSAADSRGNARSKAETRVLTSVLHAR
jgi:hypothetical protein